MGIQEHFPTCEINSMLSDVNSMLPYVALRQPLCPRKLKKWTPPPMAKTELSVS